MLCSRFSRAFSAVLCILTFAGLPTLAGGPGFADEPNLTGEQQADFLLHAKVIQSRERCSPHKGVTQTWLLTLSDGTITHDACFQPVHETKTTFQPDNGPPQFNFKDWWEFDVAGYRIAKLLGLDDMVPVYVERKWNGMSGSVTWWIPGVQFDEADRHKRNVPVPPEFIEGYNKQMYKVRLMTELFYDSDVNLTNVLITKEWKVWRIDFTRAFRSNTDLKDPTDLVKCDRDLLAKLRALSFDGVLDATKPYLTKSDVKSLMARRDKIVARFDKLIAEKGEPAVLY